MEDGNTAFPRHHRIDDDPVATEGKNPGSEVSFTARDRAEIGALIRDELRARVPMRVPGYVDELEQADMLSTLDVIDDLKFWQKYLLYALCGLAFVVWLMLMGGRRDDR